MKKFWNPVKVKAALEFVFL